MGIRRLQFLPPTEALDLDNGLSLAPRLKLLLTIYRSDPSVRPIDEWHLKRSLLDFLKSSLSITVPEDDLHIERSKDLKKRKREDPVASGTLYIRDLSFLKKREGDDVEDDHKRFVEWRRSVVDRMEGIELNLEGVKFRLNAGIPASDDFELLKKSWEEFYALGSRASHSRGVRQRADTLVLEGVPSRWFAEPRVSSKPSMLVTHTIFSVFGKIRNLNVAGDDDLGKTDEEGKGVGIVSGLQCKIWVQFENHDDFCNAVKVLCGRSMQKQGSRLRVDYEVSWDKDGFFRNIQQKAARNHVQERVSQSQEPARYSRNEAPRLQSQVTRYSSDGAHPKRFRD
ncbi:uncharacterized protein LOC131218939 isoform X2 [Magnolia sinica]|uniref:uncharacterized protein LOC131218939 isoform X2 n=1 Tax=Magnolia sinica TaxID=86752 RepID=UPI002658D39E|nr:uncharacterized protein LOC131218939 isoform X2 [Magnolia sinica]